MGARARVRDLGDRAGVGAARSGSSARSAAAAHGRSRWRPGSAPPPPRARTPPIAIARSLFAKGASAASALAFQFASTNLVVELGVVIVGAARLAVHARRVRRRALLIAIMTLLLRAVRLSRLEAQRASTPGRRRRPRTPLGRRRCRCAQRLRSSAAWSDVAHNFRNDWAMVYREIAVGFVLAGFVGLLGNDFFNACSSSTPRAVAGARERDRRAAGRGRSASSARSATSRSLPCCGRAGSASPASSRSSSPI